jgi:hypothetical protein
VANRFEPKGDTALDHVRAGHAARELAIQIHVKPDERAHLVREAAKHFENGAAKAEPRDKSLYTSMATSAHKAARDHFREAAKKEGWAGSKAKASELKELGKEHAAKAKEATASAAADKKAATAKKWAEKKLAPKPERAARISKDSPEYDERKADRDIAKIKGQMASLREKHAAESAQLKSQQDSTRAKLASISIHPKVREPMMPREMSPRTPPVYPAGAKEHHAENAARAKAWVPGKKLAEEKTKAEVVKTWAKNNAAGPSPTPDKKLVASAARATERAHAASAKANESGTAADHSAAATAHGKATKANLAASVKDSHSAAVLAHTASKGDHQSAAKIARAGRSAPAVNTADIAQRAHAQEAKRTGGGTTPILASKSANEGSAAVRRGENRAESPSQMRALHAAAGEAHLAAAQTHEKHLAEGTGAGSKLEAAEHKGLAAVHAEKAGSDWDDAKHPRDASGKFS